MKNDIKSLFLDISLLYKNIIHWNISKILILIHSIFLGFLFILPSLLLFFVYSLFSWNEFMDIINSFFNWIYMNWFIWNLIYVFTLVSFVLGYFYSFILVLNLNKKYLNWEKMPYLKNEFLNTKLILNYVLLSLLNFVLFLIPVLFFILLLSLIIFAFWWVESVISLLVSSTNSVFPLISLVLFVTLLIILFYLFYRFIFSYFLLVEIENKDKKVYNLLIESFFKTSWIKKFIKFCILILIVFSLYLPFSIIWSYINWNYKDLNNYVTYISLNEADREQLKQISPYDYEWLEIKYSELEINNIEKLQYNFYFSSLVFTVLEFILMFWLFNMFLTSFYNNNVKNSEFSKKNDF